MSAPVRPAPIQPLDRVDDVDALNRVIAAMNSQLDRVWDAIVDLDQRVSALGG